MNRRLVVSWNRLGLLAYEENILLLPRIKRELLSVEARSLMPIPTVSSWFPGVVGDFVKCGVGKNIETTGMDE
jgi:hypothetical protein